MQEVEYEVLNILEFNSTRKLMIVVLRRPDNRILLYCKVVQALGMALRHLGPQPHSRQCWFCWGQAR